MRRQAVRRETERGSGESNKRTAGPLVEGNTGGDRGAEGVIAPMGQTMSTG